MQQPEIEYPCEWEYRVIGSNDVLLRHAVAEIFADKIYTLSLSNVSSGAKYLSLAVTTIVINEEERNNLYVSLRKHSAVKIVI
jgi:hypothetical protein